jgi:hypothetical protein
MSKRKLTGIIIGSIAVIVVIVAIRTQIEPPIANHAVVQFADAGLEAAVRETVDILEGTIDPSDLQWLVYLDVSARNIGDLTGLEYLINVTWLTLQDNQVSDISVLASLTGLEELELGSNQIRDISPLTDLPNLTWLDLSHNQISDISALVDNPGLGEGDEVDLRNNPLGSDSINIYLPELQARGVTIDY